MKKLKPQVDKILSLIIATGHEFITKKMGYTPVPVLVTVRK